MSYFNQRIEDIMQALNTSVEGLNSSECEKGKNKLATKKKTPLIIRFFQQLADPMIIILLIAAAVSGVLAYLQGDSYTDVIIILVVVLINSILGVVQESKAEAAIEALNDMAASKSKVIRDGKVSEILSEDLNVGDIVLLEAGDAVPADGRLIDAAALKIEESALTGESVPVDKLIDVLGEDVPLADRTNMVYMGSTVAYGRAKYVVTAIGMDTEMGKIAGALHNAADNKTPLQIKMAQLSKALTWIVLGVCIAVFAVQMIRAGGLEFKYIIDSFMIAVSLAVAAIPEGLPAVVTIVLSIGVTDMSKRNAIIRKLTAVEALGCAQIICSDKTGTLTQNKMTVVDYYGDDELVKRAMGLCNDATLDQGEPTELGLYQWSKFDKDSCKRIDEKPFDSERKMMSTLHEDGYQYTKGAPDVILSKCANCDKNAIFEANKAMADKALRVLACARKKTDKIEESNMEFIGLVGMMDPVRPEVKDSIAECFSAGITPIMITGDHIDTACAIAKQLGILNEAITGTELDAMSDEEFNSRFKSITVYARVGPEHKTRIVKAWQEAGNVVAMTGDGVNDAPSIKTADIGIGMGITGTDVTKNVADMVLADDNFATIVNAVEEGRRIYSNIRKAIQFLLGSNMAEVLAVFTASMFGFLILRPVHLLWINLITDCFPALALGFEDAEPGIMERKPRPKSDGVFAEGMGFDIVYQGVMVTALVLISYFIGCRLGGELNGITMAFITMSMSEIFHSFNMRSRRQSIFKLKKQNWFLWGAAIVSLIATTAVCEIPFLASAFQFASVEINEYGIAIGLAVLVIPIVELVKFLQRHMEGSQVGD